MRYFTILFALALLISSCGTTETVSEADADRPVFDIDEEIAEEYLAAEMDEFDRLLYENRSRLSDRFATIEHDIPDIFLREVVREESEAERYAGFRVQIISTRNVAEADSLQDDFRAWANERFDNYEPEVYILFRQPYYRVRTGDFRDRNQAIEFSRLVKNRYPEAWVVHDRIEPELTPRRDAPMRFKERLPSLQNIITD
ncbi:MAG: SPOR domain-containing protein [Balneolaceae bacterium]|nr:MAG: SPOR domain-containing protein [Balneolaceae bacterium]